MYQDSIGQFSGVPPDFLSTASMPGTLGDLTTDMAMDMDMHMSNVPSAPAFQNLQGSQLSLPDQSGANVYTQQFSTSMTDASNTFQDSQHGMDSAMAVQATSAGADIDPNAIGGGPLPAGFNTNGSQDGAPQGSTLTDFTKRRNWSQRVLEELRDFYHILTPEGRLLYCSPSAKELTGWEPSDLVGKFINDYVHPDDAGLFIVEFNEAIASGNPLRFFYRFRRRNNTYAVFEARGHAHLSSEMQSFAAGMGRAFCRGFFMMSRPYPTKNAQMLDSFLEHKIEKERLTRRIHELHLEAAEEQKLDEQHWQNRMENNQNGSTTASDTHRTDGRGGADSEAISASGAMVPGGILMNPGQAEKDRLFREMPPPAKPSISNVALTRQNLDEALAASKPDSINDKMARYEGLTNFDSIEMLTGLRYRDGERSKGISTGDTSPHLIRGDVGIAILTDRDRKENKASKKLKVADEYVCTDCGTLDSPEWRKGPNGPKTLCNACGLRWAKKEKKKSNTGGSVSGHAGSTGMSTPAGLPLHASSGSG